jgi:Ca2+-binding EF-hand superfamily protein
MMNLVTCPICNKQINENIINAHIDNKCSDNKKNFQSKITFNRQRDENHEIRKKVKIHDEGKDGKVPLAEMMRPAEFKDFEGQEKAHSILQVLLTQKLVPSIILYGPPGCGN